ncbi:MAG: alpha/beta hydrolase [Hyphomicrobiaceae bacterium]|nr:alpha/beta hydrolase [Hyphomicrobiaceae bacterium]
MTTTESFAWESTGVRWRTDYDVVGNGPDALLLPALSSVSARAEMVALARLLQARHRCIVPDWPGFGAARGPDARLTPEVLVGFLRGFVARIVQHPALVVAAGHGAAYVMTVAREMPDALSSIVLVAPTWRGPLPTAMGEHRRRLWATIRRWVELPAIGPVLYRLNVNRVMVGRMLRGHVYGDPKFTTDRLLEHKTAITRRPRARFATAAFVTGGLDLVTDRPSFLGLFDPKPKAPVLVLIGSSTPPKSRAEMDALAALPTVRSEVVPGSLAAHEEHPERVAAAISGLVGTLR